MHQIKKISKFHFHICDLNNPDISPFDYIVCGLMLSMFMNSRWPVNYWCCSCKNYHYATNVFL